jgi:HK97 family phage prohead protease
MIYAIDFDGTLATGGYPDVTKAKPIEEMVKHVKKLKADKHKLILWTNRTGDKLEDAVDFCKDQEIELDAVNENLPEMIEKYGSDPRKIYADKYIDDKAINVSEITKRNEGAEVEERSTEYKTDREYRLFEARAQQTEDGHLELYGTPILFETPTIISEYDDAGKIVKYIEVIDRAALDNTDMSNTALKNNHKDFLARVRNKSLYLIKTPNGLDMRAVLPDTQKSKDVFTEVKEGLMPEMSFAFPPAELGTKSVWSRSADGTPMRRITHIPKLIDVSTVYNGAYSGTSVYARSLKEMDIEMRVLDSEKKQPDGEAENEVATLREKIRLKGKM